MGAETPVIPNSLERRRHARNRHGRAEKLFVIVLAIVSTADVRVVAAVVGMILRLLEVVFGTVGDVVAKSCSRLEKGSLLEHV